MPAYNEGSNIKTVVKEWYPIIKKFGNKESRLVVVDDGSKDDTLSILKSMSNSKSALNALTKKNSGHGATVLYGYNYALKHGADFVFQTDSDGQTRPEEFEKFWNLKDKYDIIIGHREKREDGLSRIVVTRTLRRIVKWKFKVWAVDANTPYRLMSAKTLAENIKFIPKDYNLANVILTVVYLKRHQKIKYLPITFRPRQGGINSINLKRIFNIGKFSLKDFSAINKSIDKKLKDKNH